MLGSNIPANFCVEPSLDDMKRNIEQRPEVQFQIENANFRTWPPATYKDKRINFPCLSVILQFIIVLLLIKLLNK